MLYYFLEISIFRLGRSLNLIVVLDYMFLNYPVSIYIYAYKNARISNIID
jgi:hypothetical protein